LTEHDELSRDKKKAFTVAGTVAFVSAAVILTRVNIFEGGAPLMIFITIQLLGISLFSFIIFLVLKYFKEYIKTVRKL
jgi:hypothetical protein